MRKYYISNIVESDGEHETIIHHRFAIENYAIPPEDMVFARLIALYDTAILCDLWKPEDGIDALVNMVTETNAALDSGDRNDDLIVPTIYKRSNHPDDYMKEGFFGANDTYCHFEHVGRSYKIDSIHEIQESTYNELIGVIE